MKKIKNLLAIGLTISLLLSSVSSIYASEIENNEDGIEVTYTPEEINKELKTAMDELEKELQEMQKKDMQTRGPQYHYKTKYLSYQYKNVSGYAGNQLPGGYSFPKGGSLWFSNTGGPSVSSNISVSLPSPYNFISFSVNLGQKGSSGYSVKIPANSNHYKIYVTKTIELHPYVTYRAPSGTQNWKVWNSGAVKIENSIKAVPKRV